MKKKIYPNKYWSVFGDEWIWKLSQCGNIHGEKKCDFQLALDKKLSGRGSQCKLSREAQRVHKLYRTNFNFKPAMLVL